MSISWVAAWVMSSFMSSSPMPTSTTFPPALQLRSAACNTQTGLVSWTILTKLVPMLRTALNSAAVHTTQKCAKT